MTLGGRAAEEIVFGEITTGASNDLEKVDRDGEADGHALRHVRAARPARLRPRPRRSRSSAASSPPSPTTPTRSPARSTTRSAASSRRPTRRAKDILTEHRERARHASRRSCSSARRSSAEQFVALLDGKPEDEVFGADDRRATAPSRRRAAAESAGSRGVPRGRSSPPPRPGFAGGAAEMRADELD